MFFIDRKAILLVHGFAGGSYDYANLGNDLEMYADFDIFTFTLPGHEDKTHEKVTREDFIKSAEDQIERLIKHGYTTIYVIGHSMGGVIACHLARKYKQVKKLILAAPAFRYFSFKGDKFDLIGSLKKTPAIFHEYKKDTILSRIFKMPLPTILEFTKLVEEHEDDPKYLNCPTLIIQGLNDNIVPIDSSEYVYKAIKSTVKCLVKIKGATHDIFKSDTYDEILDIIVKFLRKNQNKEKEEIIEK